MSVGGDFFQFLEGELQPLEQALEDSLSVADSFLVSDGLVRGLEHHLTRFSNSIANEKTKRQLAGFFAESIRQIPKSGDWFPRFEYRDSQPEGKRLFLRIRPAPERTETCTLWTSTDPDPRINPTIKGPDLAICQQLRRAANLHGADEAVLIDSEGFIADGALSSIVWWEKDVLCGPDESTKWLPSITRQLVFEIASQAGYQTLEVRRRPQDLSGCEVWTLSALQGIRGVTKWGEIPLSTTGLLSPFRKRLALLAKPLPTDEEIMSVIESAS